MLIVKSEPIISLIVNSLASAIQEKLINLVLEIRGIQNSSLNSTKKIIYPNSNHFCMEVSRGWWNSEYFYLLLIYLPISNTKYYKLFSFLA